MSATVKITSHVEVTLGGELIQIGSKYTPTEVTITGERFEVIKNVTNIADPHADDYRRQLLWETGDGGITDFDVLVCVSDIDCLLELSYFLGSRSYATIKLEAGVPFILANDDIINTVTVHGTATTLDLIDQIAVQNPSATATTATVRLLLLT